jgi:hypothetical protein
MICISLFSKSCEVRSQVAYHQINGQDYSFICFDEGLSLKKAIFELIIRK